ncbi:PadR family transcriptional regulator [Zongyangia hominis]|uniref:PadR family transcriptional regulator n=1 Tax=Zongyangia hominis TaxID=2763677 RepID=A0A926I6H0_9FIRM|nr:PadR family transcriptional regulator [Zongyangia hominis]MBC8570044.1 PadR family transcriptional regulator [Zongyangia hominis]
MAFQLGASLLEACVLALLEREDTYGYILTQNIRSVIEISESTLYPVLRRLQKEECLSTYDMPCQGRNRRYYQITPTGLERLEHYRMDWTEYKNKVDLVLSGGKEHECK